MSKLDYAAGSSALGARLRPNPDVVVQKMGNATVLLHLRSNRFYQLNSTGSRLWELLSAGQTPIQIRENLLQEFEIDEPRLTHEITALLASMKKENLVIDDE
jgi:Coenzyme PQQ synthesis protein D (PqqD)